jgi:alpha/beta hydrolase fold
MPLKTKICAAAFGVLLLQLMIAVKSLIVTRAANSSNKQRTFRQLHLHKATLDGILSGCNSLYKQLELIDVDDVKRKVYYADIGTDSVFPPLVILCGTAQTVNTFSPHFRQISKTRRLIIIELRCQGQTELLSKYGTIDQHVKDFHDIVVNHLGLSHIHLAGFSFGGRVSLAIAATYPKLVGRLSVTGVPFERPALGNSRHC